MTAAAPTRKSSPVWMYREAVAAVLLEGTSVGRIIGDPRSGGAFGWR